MHHVADYIAQGHIFHVFDWKIKSRAERKPLPSHEEPLRSQFEARNRNDSPACQPFIQMQIKENIKAPRHWPLCGEFTGDRWIPRTNGQ